jgi:predicted phage terminase large subunit-like protein
VSEFIDLIDAIPALSPRFSRPDHLAPVIARLSRALVEPLRLVISTPPRHGKTECLLHAIPWWLLQQPSTQIAYVSYAAGIAQRKSRKALHLARRAGVPLDDDAAAKGDWRTGVDDGGVLAFGIDGQATGEGFHIVIADDLVKNRATAESELAREQLAEAVNDDLFTRLEPDGSFIVCMTRWHEDDVPGRLIRSGWEYIRLPALDEKTGQALWPARFTTDRLMKIREQLGEYAWASLYQGEPRPRGGALFKNTKTYATLPDKYRVRIGVDLAYTAKKRSDYSAAVVVASDPNGLHYVLEVVREQVAAPDFATKLRALRDRYPGAAMTAYVAGIERGTIDFMSRAGIAITAVSATEDKFMRAQPAAALWNAGKVFVPSSATSLWVTPFLNELLAFTGVNDKRDDQVDALAGCFHGIAIGEHRDGPGFMSAGRAVPSNGAQIASIFGRGEGRSDQWWR